MRMSIGYLEPLVSFKIGEPGISGVIYIEVSFSKLKHTKSNIKRPCQSKHLLLGHRDNSPATGDNSPATRDNLPATRDNLLATRDNSPATRDNSPATRDNLPATREV